VLSNNSKSKAVQMERVADLIKSTYKNQFKTKMIEAKKFLRGSAITTSTNCPFSTSSTCGQRHWRFLQSVGGRLSEQ